MTEPRKSTVYDLTSLRLHPDGTRVLLTENNRRLRVSKYSVQDSRGNWIATDAGGSGHVTRYRALREGGRERADEDVEDELESRTADEEGLLKDYRAKKRRKFQHDFDFISSSPVPRLESSFPESNGTEDNDLPLPSSDLLKCIHYMTCHFYHERGQLLNSSREFRKQKKMRRLAKLRQSTKVTEDAEDDEENEDESDSDLDEEDHDTDSDEDDRPTQPSGPEEVKDSDEDDEEKEERKSSTSAMKKQKRERNPVIDMYRTMNGSALMALGMLVQEHIAQVFRSRIPENWEEGLREFESENESENEEVEAEEKSLSDEGENDTQDVEDTLRDNGEGGPSRDTLSPTFHDLDQSSSSDEG
ncbi:hypothetical protein PQX77_008868 [Marasmius sp. AFHP31]|nr:hypothetical protein PQX77_008868 [Marasmius sp. AFHP31]